MSLKIHLQIYICHFMCVQGMNVDAVSWLDVFAEIQENPGYYSEALMNM